MQSSSLRLEGWTMGYLYSQGRKHCDPRYCQTHAAVTDLFANRSSDRDCAATWAYLSDAWENLARIKRALTDERTPNWPNFPNDSQPKSHDGRGGTRVRVEVRPD